MKRNSFKDMENRVKKYFDTENKIKILKEMTVSLQEKKSNIENKIKDLNLDFDINIKAASFEQRINGSSNNSSYFEKNIMNQIQKKEEIIERIIEEIADCENKITILETENLKIKMILNLMDSSYRELLELKYKKNKSEVDICNTLYISIAQYYRRKKKALETIYNIMVMYGEIN